jgi:uncharacterized iron-regulated membrane protein
VGRLRRGAPRLRTLWLKIHLYIGLFAGFVFVLLGLTGSFLVYHDEIDRALNPGLLAAHGQGPALPLDDIVAAAQAAHPASVPLFVSAPATAGGTWLVDLEIPNRNSEENWLTVGVDPATGAVVGKREPGAHFVSIVYDLHARLLLGRTGEIIAGITGILILVSLATGLYLWWPKLPQLRRALTIKRGTSGRRFLLDLHNVPGVYALVVLAVLTFSGVYLVFPDQVIAMVDAAADVEPVRPEVASTISPGAAPISLGQAVAAATRPFRGAEFGFAIYPEGSDGAYRVVLRQPGEVRKTGGSTSVWVDQYSGKLLAAVDPTRFGAGNDFINWQFPLHNGEAFGAAGRIVAFISGLLPLLLYVTGFLLWWRKRKSARSRDF